MKLHDNLKIEAKGGDIQMETRDRFTELKKRGGVWVGVHQWESRGKGH